MSCIDPLQLQAYFDGELPHADALLVERHVATCVACTAALADLRSISAEIRMRATYHRIDASPNAAGLARRIDLLLDEEEPSHVKIGRGQPVRPAFTSRAFFSGAASGATVMAFAAALMLFAINPHSSDPLVTDVVNAHLRSMMSDHLVDVASSDRHTVKPWFANHADVSPPAIDFSAEGYHLVGGRADYVDGRRTAVVIYRHGAHTINVFAWKAGDESPPPDAMRNGLHVVFWKKDDLIFCAVADTGVEELLSLKRLYDK